MRLKTVAALVAASLCLGGISIPPAHAAEEDIEAIAQVADEIAIQQKQIVANQVKINAALAEVKEELRIARIYSSRSGGKKTP